ncbi:MAG TPA: hypothetical protein VN578_01170, partial [Candidatus Binatia bacterium]|nr:hypothetical protein [Candidatus Binatia bacterium]
MKRNTANYALLLLLLTLTGTVRAEGYRTSLGSAPDDFPVVVVSGTPYEMGVSLGRLMKPEIQAFAPLFVKEAQLFGGQQLSSTNLVLAWSTMEPFISARFQDELRGLA